MNDRSSNRIAFWIFVAIAVWGGLLALGATLFGIDPQTGEVTWEPNLQRGLMRGGILLACVAIFLGGWGLLLKQRSR